MTWQSSPTGVKQHLVMLVGGVPLASCQPRTTLGRAPRGQQCLRCLHVEQYAPAILQGAKGNASWPMPNSSPGS